MDDRDVRGYWNGNAEAWTRLARDGYDVYRDIEVGDYFRPRDGELSEWTFGQAPPEVRAGVAPFRIPQFTRTLSWWLTLFLDAGWHLERLEEPRPSDEVVRRFPRLQDATVTATFLHLRVRRP